MRFFEIVISDPATGKIFVPNFNGIPGFSLVDSATATTYSSLNAGANVFTIGGTNPAAQLIELDISVSFAHAPGLAMPHLRIHGIGLGEIGQASNLNGKYVSIFGGMAKGLGLANPAQSGCLFRGQIWQSFANWIGTDQTLEMYVGIISSPSSSQTTGQPATTNTTPTPNTGPLASAPANLTFQWQTGQPLLGPLVQCLQQAYPQYSIVGAVHDGLVWSGQAATGFFQTFKQLADYINQASLSLISGYAPPVFVSSTPQYPGVWMVVHNGVIMIGDGTTATNPKQIQFVDLIGQPTWTSLIGVQVTTVLRADISAGDYVVLPQTPGVTVQGSNSQNFSSTLVGNPYTALKNGSIFTGTFMVTGVRHVGNSRSPDATSWVSTLDLILQTSPQQTVAKLPALAAPTTAANSAGSMAA